MSSAFKSAEPCALPSPVAVETGNSSPAGESPFRRRSPPMSPLISPPQSPNPQRRSVLSVLLVASSCLAFLAARHAYLRGRPERLIVAPRDTTLTIRHGEVLHVAPSAN